MVEFINLIRSLRKVESFLYIGEVCVTQQYHSSSSYGQQA